ncbi:T9SS type A sorting domain-containing protein [uncultured Flavobacterium sp.]|uniref:T9SS type A sorting domain-containing protein n=1 Tax=uncultured Flavobacterium sp. TaxID=165435 RepID=UPI0025F35571|nr:T9SS type A sorting domain-containing protein [uncultured Flavobacterium sp.]
MKKITILAMLLMAGYSGHAQLSYEAVGDFGRLEGLTYDLSVENKLYAVSLNNHIVVSYDNGETWDLMYAYPNTNARITNLIMLPGNENLCFSIANLYTEEDGIYILNIQDNEIVSTFDAPDEEGVNIVNFDIYDSEATTILLSANTSEGDKVFYTTTGGENWTEVYAAADNNNVSVRNVAISPDNASKLFIIRGQGSSSIDGGLLISADSGETWTEKLAGIPLNPIDFNPTDVNDIILGTDVNFTDVDENLYRSLDGGNTWAIVPVAWNDALFDHLLVVKFHPQQDNIIYVLETDQIAYTEDGGATWLATLYPEEEYYAGQQISINPFASKEAAITANMYPVRTTDGGATLNQINAPFCTVNSVSAVKFGATEHLYYGAQGGHLHKNYATNMTDAYNIESAAAWSPSAVKLMADPLNEGRVFMYEGGGMMGGNLYMSTDHGATRATLMPASGVISVAVHPSNDNILYAVIDDLGVSALYKLDITDLENVISTPITTPVEQGYIGGILAYADKLVLVKDGSVYKSEDDGANWTGIYTVPGAVINDISANPLSANAFGIATSNGVYTTADGGATWTTALQGVVARKVAFSDLNDGVMAVGVYNGELTTNAYITYYNGAEWVTVSSEEMNYLQSYAMDFNFVGDNINAYVGTIDMGIIRYSFPIETMGTENPSLAQNKVFLAPNPASDIVTVQTSQLAPVTKVAVYTITGQKVMESAQPSINISHLSKGVYVVKAETASGAVTSAKLVKE